MIREGHHIHIKIKESAMATKKELRDSIDAVYMYIQEEYNHFLSCGKEERVGHIYLSLKIILHEAEINLMERGE